MCRVLPAPRRSGARVVDHLHANQPSRAPSVPSGVVQRDVVFAPAVEPARREWFVAGTESSAESTTNVTTISMPTAEAAPRVLSPADGTVIAPDPDIPAARQSMLVRAEAPQATRVCLKLGARPLAPCGVREVLVALPAPGRHQIRLENCRRCVVGAGDGRSPRRAALARGGHLARDSAVRLNT